MLKPIFYGWIEDQSCKTDDPTRITILSGNKSVLHGPGEAGMLEVFRRSCNGYFIPVALEASAELRQLGYMVMAEYLVRG